MGDFEELYQASIEVVWIPMFKYVATYILSVLTLSSAYNLY